MTFTKFQTPTKPGRYWAITNKQDRNPFTVLVIEDEGVLCMRLNAGDASINACIPISTLVFLWGSEIKTPVVSL